MTSEIDICTVILGQMMEGLETVDEEIKEIENDSHDRNLAMAWVNDYLTQWQTGYNIGVVLLDPFSSWRKIFDETMKSLSKTLDDIASKVSKWE